LEVFPSLARLVTVAQSRLGKLREFPQLVSYFLKLPEYEPEMLVFRKSDHNSTVKGLQSAREQLAGAGKETWASEERLSQVLERIVDSSGLSNGDVFWPVRVALTGQDRSPSPAECLWVLGKDESLKRIDLAIQKLSS